MKTQRVSAQRYGRFLVEDAIEPEIGQRWTLLGYGNQHHVVKRHVAVRVLTATSRGYHNVIALAALGVAVFVQVPVQHGIVAFGQCRFDAIQVAVSLTLPYRLVRENKRPALRSKT